MLQFFDLPYRLSALEPFFSEETLAYHYLKHHKTYYDNLINLIEKNPELADLSLEQIIAQSQGTVFNNAAQIWNHDFFWQCLCPSAEQKSFDTLSSEFQQALIKKFGSLEEFKAKFSDVALKTFGSGWAWLVKNSAGELEIISTSNALTPITTDLKPLLTCDVWEHAYYIDYRNSRAEYLKAFWSCVNWDFVDKQFLL